MSRAVQEALRQSRRSEGMNLFDDLPPEGRALARDYGLKAALQAISATGDWARARTLLRDMRGVPI